MTSITNELALRPATPGFTLPATIADQAAERFFTFFTDTIPNKNTRAAYYRNALRFFAWAERCGLSLPTIRSYHGEARFLPNETQAKPWDKLTGRGKGMEVIFRSR